MKLNLNKNKCNRGESELFFTIIVALIMLSFMFGMLIGDNFGSNATKKVASQHNLGRYIADPISGNTTFVWGVVTNN